MLAVFTSSSALAANSMDLHLLPKGLSDGHALDGSPAAYYFAAGESATTWVISMEGGGACYDEKSCTARSKTNLGTSTVLPPQHPGKDLQSFDCTENPLFCNATFAFIPYLSGDTHKGNRSTADAGSWNLYFQGHSSFVNIVAQLKSQHGLNNASHVVFTGNSAGGVGVFANVDWLQSALPSAVVKGAPNAGWFFPGSLSSDQPKYPNNPPSDWAHFSKNESGGAFNSTFDLMITKLWEPIVSEECVGAQANPLDCGSVHVAYQYIKAPMFVVENQYDTNQLVSQEGAPRSPPSGSLGATWRAYIGLYGASMRASTAQVMTIAEKHGDGLFHPSCLQHGVTGETINGGGWIPIFNDWFWGLGKLTAKYKQVETCPQSFDGLPCNPDAKKCQVPSPTPGPGPGPPSGGCSAQLRKDACSTDKTTQLCEACAELHRKDLTAAGCSQKDVVQLCKAVVV
jgi:hypothetical protein